MLNFKKSKSIKKNKDGGIFEFFRTIFYAVVIAIIFRSFLFEPYNIPSGSMLPNLLIGDYLFVSKYSYGYSRYSFPFGIMPLPKRVLGNQPERGDVVVFKLPSNTKINYIKRVVGLPGDKVQMKNGKLYLNDTLIQQKDDGNFIFTYKNQINSSMRRLEESLPNGRKYSILNLNDSQSLDNTREFYVPKQHYFMMGDNRDNSMDSRANVGFVPFENLVGKGGIIFFSVNGYGKLWQIWRWPSSIRFNRFFKRIQ